LDKMEQNQGFTEEQIKEIQAISKLEGEEKKPRLEKFLSGLTEEQKKLLKLSGCIYCGVVNGSIKSFKIYEDEVLVCVMDVRPATRGHVVVVPKQHYFVSGQMDEKITKHVFDVANKLSRIVFEAMGAEGTNILVSNGFAAGQKIEHFVVHIIPRYKDDGLKFDWEGLTVGEEDITKDMDKIRGMVGNLTNKEPEKVEEIVEEKQNPKEEVVYEDEERVP